MNLMSSWSGWTGQMLRPASDVDFYLCLSETHVKQVPMSPLCVAHSTVSSKMLDFSNVEKYQESQWHDLPQLSKQVVPLVASLSEEWNPSRDTRQSPHDDNCHYSIRSLRLKDYQNNHVHYLMQMSVVETKGLHCMLQASLVL